MKSDSLSRITLNSLKDVARSPLLIAISLILFLGIMIFSQLSLVIDQRLTTNVAKTLWLVCFVAIALAIGSFLFAGMLGVCASRVKPKDSAFRTFIAYAKTFWWRNLQTIVLLVVLGGVLNYLAIQLARLFLPLGAQVAIIFLFLFIVAGLLGGLIFLTFISFYAVIGDRSSVESVRESASFVKKNYLEVMAILVLFFVASSLIQQLPNLGSTGIWAAELIESVFLFPLFLMVLTRFLITRHSSLHAL